MHVCMYYVCMYVICHLIFFFCPETNFTTVIVKKKKSHSFKYFYNEWRTINTGSALLVYYIHFCYILYEQMSEDKIVAVTEIPYFRH